MRMQVGTVLDSGIVGPDHAQQAMKRGIRMDHARRMATLAILRDAQAAGDIRRNALDTGQQVQHVVLGGLALLQ